MQLAASPTHGCTEDWRGSLLVACAAWLAAATFCALLAPAALGALLAGTAALGLVFLAFRHTVGFCVAWLLIAGSTLEMAIGDWLGGGAYQSIIALVKAAELGLGIVCILRFGPRLDAFNPAFAYLFIFAGGLVHGLHPGLTPADSLRSLIGSAAPFVFCFSRVSLGWANGMIRMTRWIPLLTVAAAAILAATGFRPLGADSGGWRLAGLGHPAFLGGFCLSAIYAGWFELLRDGRRRELALLGINFGLLLATGARAPTLYAAVVGLAVLLATRSAAFPARTRLGLLLGLVALLPLVLLAAGALPQIRLFNLLTGEAGNLSGRDILWPLFERAAAASPWLGWGIGAGNVIIAPGSEVAELIGSRAAHNEYLRMSVEGGEIGRCLLIVLFLLWGLRGSAGLPRDEKLLMRLILLAFAGHAYTDNLLISTSACVFFTLITAVFARSRLEAQASPGGLRRPRDKGIVRQGSRATFLASVLPVLLALLVVRPASAGANGLAYVVNSAGASISVVDMARQTELRRIPVLREPHHLVLSPDGKQLLVGDTVANEMLFLDPRTGEVRQRVAMADPYQLGFSPNGRYLVVNGLARNQIDVYDGATLKLRKRFPVATMPSHLAFSPDSSMVFVSLQGTDRLTAIDLNTMTVRWTQPVGRTPAGVMWHNGQVMVANMGSDNVALVDPVDGRVTGRIVTGKGAHTVFLSPDRRIVYVNNRVAGTTVALDAVTLKPLRSYSIPGGPDDMDFAPDGRIWITRRFAEKLAVLDPVSGQYQTIEVGRSPHGILLHPTAP